MSGCVSIAGIALLCYAVSVGPWFVFPEYERTGLASAVGVGAGLASLVGAIATSRLKLAGIVGFAGGTLSAGVFQYLRLNHTFASIQDPETPDPNYAQAAVFLVPLGWVVYVATATALFVWIARSALQET
ncbi:MAG: hypothetical protein IT207_09850 [Fimbriimonadaceae bacterium]|nr:hypothetical protein [Fimbriimonadaceae bacterium]